MTYEVCVRIKKDSSGSMSIINNYWQSLINVNVFFSYFYLMLQRNDLFSVFCPERPNVEPGMLSRANSLGGSQRWAPSYHKSSPQGTLQTLSRRWEVGRGWAAESTLNPSDSARGTTRASPPHPEYETYKFQLLQDRRPYSRPLRRESWTLPKRNSSTSQVGGERGLQSNFNCLWGGIITRWAFSLSVGTFVYSRMMIRMILRYR